MRRKKTELSASMVVCLAAAIEQGKGRLVRHQGGFWTWPGCTLRQHDGVPDTYFGTTTIQGLVARDRLKYVDWRDGQGRRFPIAVEVIDEICGEPSGRTSTHSSAGVQVPRPAPTSGATP